MYFTGRGCQFISFFGVFVFLDKIQIFRFALSFAFHFLFLQEENNMRSESTNVGFWLDPIVSLTIMTLYYAILLGMPLNGQSCVWLCFIALGAIYLGIFLLSMYTRVEYPVYRVDKGGLRSRGRETRRVRPDICIQDKSGEKESNMSYDPAHRKCLIGIKNWQRLSTCRMIIPSVYISNLTFAAPIYAVLPQVEANYYFVV